MKKLLLLLPLLSGCASTDYQRYADIQIAHAKAEEARYASMARIADSGDTTTKVAAMFALHKTSSGAQNVIQAPKSGWDIARDMLGIVLPVAVQAYGIHSNQIISTTASNNATALGISTNRAFVDMAG